MHETGGHPATLLFMLVVIFLPIYFLGILPWRRRKKKKVSLNQQIDFAAIWLFIPAGTGFLGLAAYLSVQKELSLIGVMGLVVVADHATTAILILKKSKHALISLLGSIAVYLFSVVYFWSFAYSNTDAIMPFISGAFGGLIAGVCLYTPALRGIIAIRDLEREVKDTNNTIDDTS